MRLLFFIALFLTSLAIFSCSREGWILDYGKSKAVIEEPNLVTQAKRVLGKKITLIGQVKAVDLSQENHAIVTLTSGTECHFGRFMQMAEICQIGSKVYIAGIVKKSTNGSLILSPALLLSEKPKGY